MASKRDHPFFRLVHWYRLFYLFLLAIVLLATTGQVLWRMSQPIESVPGVIEEISETRLSNQAASYELSLRTDEDGLAFVQLRNNGRILRYLLDQEALPESRVIVRHRRGTAVELALLNGTTPTIREQAAPPAVFLLVLLPGLLVLALLWRVGT